MVKNDTLNFAKKGKNDEFYTDLIDIDKELSHYTSIFRNKVVLCNCNDSTDSNFYRYFTMNFFNLRFKKLISVSYNKGGNGECYIYNINRDQDPYLGSRGDKHLANDCLRVRLKGDGDFRSPECTDLLKQADIIVTNPPFSLFREFIALMFKYNKQFLVLGNINAVTYKEIFPLIRDNKMWLGPSIKSGDRKFYIPDNYPLNAASCGIDETGHKFIRVKGVRWFTNLDHKKRHESILLTKKYYQ